MRIFPAVIALVVVIATPTSVRESAPPVLAAVPTSTALATGAPQALSDFKQRLVAEGRDAGQHGIYIETLDGSRPVAAHNAGALFNPASVMKLATSLAALDRLGADYRFRTEFRTAGEINPRTGELEGDLWLLSGQDPSFSIPDARKVGEGLRQLGIRRVTGDLVVAGAFTCNHNSQTGVSAGVFRRNSGLPISGVTRYEGQAPAPAPGRPLLTLESDRLVRLLLEQNAHSVNAMADVLGASLGGPAAVQRFLVERVGLSEETVYVGQASGLDVNRLSPQGTVALLRALARLLGAHGHGLESVMSVAGLDPGTLRDRFTGPEYAGCVVAKTGTLHSTDGGVAALAGVIYTRERGPLLFAVYDMAEGRHVLRLRQRQDEFLKRLIDELGGPAPLPQLPEPPEPSPLESRLVFAQ